MALIFLLFPAVSNAAGQKTKFFRLSALLLGGKYNFSGCQHCCWAENTIFPTVSIAAGRKTKFFRLSALLLGRKQNFSDYHHC
jgi:hypothetical protein